MKESDLSLLFKLSKGFGDLWLELFIPQPGFPYEQLAT